ncbi:hypothetical protein DBR06_SOUSAS3110021, partial [Sousa chinensis]
MGRLVVLPSKVKSLHLRLQRAFQIGLPTGLALLIPSNSQDGIPERLCPSSVYPGTLPHSLREQLHYSQKPRSSGLAGPCL